MAREKDKRLRKRLGSKEGNSSDEKRKKIKGKKRRNGSRK